MGRYGSGAQVAAAGEAYTNLANDLYGGQYAREREAMMRAATLAPQQAQQDYFDISQLFGAGQARQAQGQAELQDAINRFNFQQNLPYERLGLYNQFVQGNFGSTTTTRQPYDLLERARTGAEFGGMVLPAATGMTPWGAIGGAALGGLLGMFG